MATMAEKRKIVARKRALKKGMILADFLDDLGMDLDGIPSEFDAHAYIVKANPKWRPNPVAQALESLGACGDPIIWVKDENIRTLDDFIDKTSDGFRDGWWEWILNQSDDTKALSRLRAAANGGDIHYWHDVRSAIKKNPQLLMDVLPKELRAAAKKGAK